MKSRARPSAAAAARQRALARRIRAAQLRLSGKSFDEIATMLATTKAAAKALVNGGANYLAIAGSGSPYHEAAIEYCAAGDRELERIAMQPRPEAENRSGEALGPSFSPTLGPSLSVSLSQYARGARKTSNRRLENDVMPGKSELVDGCRVWTREAKRLLHAANQRYRWELVIWRDDPLHARLRGRIMSIRPELPPRPRTQSDHDFDIRLMCEILAGNMTRSQCHQILGELYRGEHTSLFDPIFDIWDLFPRGQPLRTDGYPELDSPIVATSRTSTVDDGRRTG